MSNVSPVLFDALVHSAGLAADLAASDRFREGAPVAQQVGAGVEAAFAHAVGLGLISITPLEEWPELRRIPWCRSDVVKDDTQ